MLAYVWVGIGGALGSMARHGCNTLYMRTFGPNTPWSSTLIINVLGSLVIGLASSMMGSEGRFPSSLTAQQFVMVGICGGYTTFSSFSLQTLTLMQGSQWLWAAANVVLSVVLCLIAVWLGHVLGTAAGGS
jgi:CrcB protein